MAQLDFSQFRRREEPRVNPQQSITQPPEFQAPQVFTAPNPAISQGFGTVAANFGQPLPRPQNTGFAQVGQIDQSGGAGLNTGIQTGRIPQAAAPGAKPGAMSAMSPQLAPGKRPVGQRAGAEQFNDAMDMFMAQQSLGNQMGGFPQMGQQLGGTPFPGHGGRRREVNPLDQGFTTDNRRFFLF